MTVVYDLWFEREYPDREDTELHIGIFATNEDALEAINRLRDQTGFRDFPEGFNIYPVTLGVTGWQAGFATVFLPARGPEACEIPARPEMKNIQIIDGADNATFSLFQATAAEFAVIFPDGRDMELAEDLFERIGEEAAIGVLTPLWERPILKREANGIHGTLFYGYDRRRNGIPQSKREVDLDDRSVNQAQRDLFARHRFASPE